MISPELWNHLILGRVIRLQHILLELLLLPRPWKCHIHFLQMSFFLLTNTDVNTVYSLSPAIYPSKKRKFLPNREKDHAILTEEVHDSCFPLMFWKSSNGDKPNEHELSQGLLSANIRQAKYILWPVRNELRSRSQ